MDGLVMSDDSLHWMSMTCPFNKDITDINNHPLYISTRPEQNFEVPPHLHVTIYHPSSIGDTTSIKIPYDIQEHIIAFVSQHDRINGGNTTELPRETLDRIMSYPSTFGLLYANDQLIGIIISLIFRTKYYDNDILT